MGLVRRRNDGDIMTTATTRDKQLTKTINHQTGTTAVMIHREFNGPDGQWWPMEPADASQDAAAIDAFDNSFSGSQQAQIAQLTAGITSANSAKQQAESDKAAALEQLAAANARIAELEAQINPPNPFPDADWDGFKFAIFADPAIDRVARANPVSWPLMVQYLSQLDTNPARGPDIAQLWNFMEAYTAITPEEVARINAISQQHGVPLHLNEEGQIVIPQ